MKLYTKQELINKYHGMFIDTYPHHSYKWIDGHHQEPTTYEVRGVSSTIKENYNPPEEV